MRRIDNIRCFDFYKFNFKDFANVSIAMLEEYGLNPNMDYRCFKVPDDSMSGSGLYAGYIVTVQKQNAAEDGKMVVAKIGNGPFRIRRVRYFNDVVLLDPDNPRYQSERTNINELEIIGIVTDASFKVK
jgi:SOS-response transcriptional repressor LexA